MDNEDICNHNLPMDFKESFRIVQYISFVLTVLTCAVGLVGNAIIIGVTGTIMKKHKCKIWFLNLALADLAFTLSLPLYAVAVWTGNWPFGSNLCKLYNYSSACNLYTSIFTIMALNIDRVLSIAKPIWHFKFFSERTCFWTCAVIWTITALLGLPVLFLSDEQMYDNKTECRMISVEQSFRRLHGNKPELSHNVEKDTHVGNKSTELLNSRLIFIPKPLGWCKRDLDDIVFITECTLIPCLVIGYFIPLVVIVFSNVIIALQGSKSQGMKSPRLYRIITAVILFFFLTWTPLVSSEIILLAALRKLNLELVYKVYMIMPMLISIAYTNCFLNPIIYVLAGTRVRAALSDFLSNTRLTFSRNSDVPSN
ncbi:C5a anaphylatoxin chemotactic receptor 1-like [Xenopus laevis]|uniref:G-protein coupled receptors family 1 profile domain-containing protein n=2 Tax=Xenopus laevis TaxID=8355 RepID=A0AA97PZ54_XENLA|nr:C5a anaphylatoxin chemotactic receptor 1-like [Xenopus laevis]OCT56502.1 hypothetical protein XELAEV_18000009mg [Xenopus laevis]